MLKLTGYKNYKMNNKIKALKYITGIESVLSVHRNFTISGKVIKLLIIVHCLAEILLIATNFYLHDLYKNYFQFNSERLYFSTSTTFSIFLILLAGYRSGSFRDLKNNLNMIHVQCENNVKYRRNIERMGKLVILYAGMLAFMLILMFIQSRFAHHFNIPDMPHLVIFLFHINLVLCDYRYNFQFLAVYCYLKIISEQIVYITESVHKATILEDEGSSPAQANAFHEWSELYTKVRQSSKLFNVTFGFQMTIMLATMTFFYTIFLYTMTSISVSVRSPDEMFVFGCIFYVFSTVLLLIELGMMSYAAQSVENNADYLKRSLARLLLHSLSISDKVYYKSSKDLLRLVRTRPIKTVAFGSIAIDMTLLPTCVVFFTYYTVIALQFNNIV